MGEHSYACDVLILMFRLKLVLIFSQRDWSGPWPREVSISCSFEHTLFFQNTPKSTLKRMLKMEQGECARVVQLYHMQSLGMVPDFHATVSI